FTELGESRNLVTQRDTELTQLRTETELERSTLETQLTELNHKAEYLFTELGESRNLVTQRDTELFQLQKRLFFGECELIRYSVSLKAEEHRNADFAVIVATNTILKDLILCFYEDVHRLTSPKIYKFRRKIRFAMRRALIFSHKRKILPNDVIPINLSPSEFIDEILNANFDSRQYRNDFQDINQSGVNPYSHYLTFGRYEGRELQKQRIAIHSNDKSVLFEEKN
ncbi:MAG: hypothetical protein WCR08_10000, partial [Gammaproteobacteria bacterium]